MDASSRKEIMIIWSLFLGFFLISTNVSVMSFVTAFIMRDIYIAEHLLGLVLAAFAISGTVTNIVIAPFLDLYGRRRTMIVGAALLTICFILTGFVESVAALIAVRLLTGICSPVLGASIAPYIVDYFPTHRRGAVMGYVMSSVHVVSIASVPAGILISGYISWRAVFFLMSMVSVLVLASMLFIIPNVVTGGTRERIGLRTYVGKFSKIFGNINVSKILICRFLSLSGTSMFTGLYSIWLIDRFSSAETGYVAISSVFLIAGCAGFAGSIFSGKVAERFSDTTTMYVVFSVFSGSMMAIAPLFPGAIQAQYAVYAMAVLAKGLYYPISQTALIGAAGSQQRGSVSGVHNAVMQIAVGTGLAAGGYLYVFDPSFVVIGIAACVLLCASAFVFSRARIDT